MAAASRDPLIATRAAFATKARFAALATSRGMTESRLLSLLIETVLEDNPPPADSTVLNDSPATDRITLRLRAGDRALLDARAAARGMKTSSYAVMLIRAHVRQQAPMPAAEIEALKVAVSHLAALRRQLQESLHTVGTRTAGDVDLLHCLRETAAHVDDMRRCVAEVVKSNLLSWESNDA